MCRSLPALGIRGIGAAPAFVALFLYSLLPVVANTVIGLARCRAAANDAARGMGMTDRQRLSAVELPLAFPVILTGIRIVLVQNIGLATIAALIGGGGFGTFVFQGIGQTAMDLVLLGAVPTVALAFAAAVLLDAVDRSDPARVDRMIEIEASDQALRRDDRGRRRLHDGRASGTIAVIVGTSGSGKSTLLRMINRLVEPSAGRVLIDGEDTAVVPEHELRRRIGYAIQGHGLFPHRTVAQNIATVPRLLGWDRRRGSTARVEELLTSSSSIRRSSRASIRTSCRAASSSASAWRGRWPPSPNVLLMDEPFGALDPIIRAKAQEDLLAIQRRFGTTIVLVTHDMEEAFHLGDRIAVHGRRPPAAICRRPREMLTASGDALRGAAGRHRPTGRSGCCR